jgi:hypothetical protein
MSAFRLITSALHPTPDIVAVCHESPFLTHSRPFQADIGWRREALRAPLVVIFWVVRFAEKGDQVPGGVLPRNRQHSLITYSGGPLRHQN